MVAQNSHTVVARVSVTEVAARAVAALGYELADCEVVNRSRLLRVFIDRVPPDAGPVNVEDCERVSKQLQRALEVEGIDYDRLEVSSPGLDRSLKKPAHFRRFLGERVELRVRVPVAGRRRFTGALVAADDDGVEVEVEGARHRFFLADLERARLVPRY